MIVFVRSLSFHTQEDCLVFARRLIAAVIATTILLAHQAAIATLSAAPPLRALIVDGQNYHQWRETSPLLKKHLEKTSLFSVNEATSAPEKQDISGFKPDFAAYNVVVMNYHGDEWPDATRKALERYVAAGGGLVIVHGADLSFPAWKEYGEMIGLGWGNCGGKDGCYVYWKNGDFVREKTSEPGGGHSLEHAFPLVVRDKEHPITKGLPEKFMHASDELYHRLRGPAKNLAVLATAFSEPKQSGSGRDEPILMTVGYGKGRVFHTVLGHGAAQMKCVAFIVTFQRGAEWAATGKVAQRIPTDFPGLNQPTVRP
jgi:uncharacterized protein